ncbi:unnamed protein product, partial [Prorocentrum cordatum]
ADPALGALRRGPPGLGLAADGPPGRAGPATEGAAPPGERAAGAPPRGRAQGGARAATRQLGGAAREEQLAAGGGGASRSDGSVAPRGSSPARARQRGRCSLPAAPRSGATAGRSTGSRSEAQGRASPAAPPHATAPPGICQCPCACGGWQAERARPDRLEQAVGAKHAPLPRHDVPPHWYRKGAGRLACIS